MLDLLALESIIFTQIKARFSPKIKNKYPNLEFTTLEESNTPVKFPNVYVYLMPSIENGRTLEGGGMECGLFTFQVKVTDNSSQTPVKEIMSEIMRIMGEELSFTTISTPAYQNTKDTYWADARFRRELTRNSYL